MMVNDDEIWCHSISVRNPPANTIMKNAHQTIGSIMLALKIQNLDFEDDNPWEWIFSSTMFAIYYTVHNTMEQITSYLVFGRDTILNINHKANIWSLVEILS